MENQEIPQGPVRVASEEQLNAIAAKRMELSGIPDEYMAYSLLPAEGMKSYNVHNPRGVQCPSKISAYYATVNYIREIHQHRRNGSGIFYFGEPNQKLGMSLLASFILRAAIEEGYSGLFVPFSTFCDDLDYGYELESKELYRTVEFLVIDAVSKKSIKTPKVVDGFADIILNRRKDKLPTIFASYINPDQLCGYYSESMMSYIEEFMDKYEIKHEAGTDVERRYDIDRYIHFLQEAKRIRTGYSFWELEDLLKKFKNQYGY
jgi:DNA replication protein DnaC